MRDLKATQFARLAEDIGMQEKLHRENFTVFCPLDESVDTWLSRREEQHRNRDLKSRSLADDDATGIANVFYSHVTAGFVRYDYAVEQPALLPTENPGATIRLQGYFLPEMVRTANCVLVVSYNHFARNGIIHLVDKVLPIPTKTVADLIAADSQFSILKKLLSEAGLVNVLRSPTGNFTVFAPTDAAFRSWSRLLDNVCASNLMNNHVLEFVVCSSGIPKFMEVVNALGKHLTLTRDADNKIYVDGVQVVVRDLVGTNGVVHIIDGLLMPREAAPLSSVLRETQITEFLKLLDSADLKNDFDAKKNVTFFVPSNEAIRAMPQALQERIHSNNETLREILLHHAAESEFLFNEMKDERILRTLAGNDTHVRLRQNSVFRFPYVATDETVQCANVLSVDNVLCGSVLHIIDRLLVPSADTVTEVLMDNPELSHFTGLLRFTGLDQRLSQKEHPVTLLVPVDGAFHGLPRPLVEALWKDREKATDFLKMHILSNFLCCDQLRRSVVAGRRQVRSIDGSLLRIVSGERVPLRIGEARVLECDKVADNGVIHTLDNFAYVPGSEVYFY